MQKKFTYEDAALAVNKWAKNQLIKLNIDFDENNSIPYFIQYLNYRSKSIIQKKRTVTCSTKFSVTDENQNGFEALKKALENGNDVNAYLSKLSIKADKIDGLLDSFGVKHFHLGEKISGQFVNRTGEIALALVTSDEVFFIRTKMHGKDHPNTWFEKDALEIIHAERPLLIESFKSSSLLCISDKVNTTEDIKMYRNMGVVSFITLDDGTTYAPSKFQSVSGFPIEYSELMSYNSKQIFMSANKICEDNPNIESIEIAQLELTMEGDLTSIIFKIYDGKEFINMYWHKN